MTESNPQTTQQDNKIDAVRKPTAIDHVIERLAPLDLPAKDHFERYMRHKWRANHKPKTMFSSFTSIMLFLQFYGTLQKGDIERIERSDLEAFIEHEEERGMYITTVKTRMASIIAFLHFLMEKDILSLSLLKKRIRLKLPEKLPRAMSPKDAKSLIHVIDDARDRALILLLLRTGIRIGEALNLTLHDIDLTERKITLMEGEKNNIGRVVYLSNDLLFALKRWFSVRKKDDHYLFYGQGHGPLCYGAARSRFFHYIKKARLEHKGYTVHCLRHTCASDLLNAGMRLEVLQQLLGHQDIEVTRHYARLTDRTREEEYFRAMEIIERGKTDGE